MIQVSYFDNGGFVLHKVPLNGKTYSAWYNADGSVRDAEQTNQQLTRSVAKRETGVLAALKQLGLPYVRVQENA